MDETQIRQKMQRVLDLVGADVGTIRTGRATPALIEDILIEAYPGSAKLRLVELATISSPDPATLVISPWDQSIIGEIKKGIELSNIGLTPALAGEVIRINLPPLTAEDRENYIRLLHQKLEAGRVQIRQIRHEFMRQVEDGFKNKELSEDEKIFSEKRLQEITDEFTGKIEELGRSKEEELRSL